MPATVRGIGNENGLTVLELRKYLESFPDDGEVWLTDYKTGLTNVCVMVDPLNRSDVLLSPHDVVKPEKINER